MITQIEIDGLKTFKDFKVELAPFQVIVGANGSGKSNLFDALHLLSRLAFLDLPVAFQQIRGEVGELFTALPDGQRTNRTRLVVELLVNREVSGGGEAPQDEPPPKHTIPLQYTRLRYAIEIVLDIDPSGLNRLHIAHESLQSISQDEDHWSKKYGILPGSSWLPEHMAEEKIFIDTQFADVGTGIIEHPHIPAVQEELNSLRFLHLNTEMLRAPSSTIGSSFLSSEGKGLARMLARIQAEDEVAMGGVSLDMANLVPGILDIRVEQDKASDKYIIFANTSDDRSFSSRVLSDGTPGSKLCPTYPYNRQQTTSVPGW